MTGVGFPLWSWFALAALMAALLVADLGFNRRAGTPTLGRAIATSGAWIASGLGFAHPPRGAAGIGHRRAVLRRVPAREGAQHRQRLRLRALVFRRSSFPTGTGIVSSTTA